MPWLTLQAVIRLDRHLLIPANMRRFNRNLAASVVFLGLIVPSSDARSQQHRSAAVVTIDGEPAGVLKYGELPPSLHARTQKFEGGSQALHFLFSEYLEKLGVPLAEVRAVHVFGGRGRVARLDGAELRQHRNDLFFDFSRETRGFPRFEWPEDAFIKADLVDNITALAIYRKTSPAARSSFTDVPDGARVYLDDRFVGVLPKKDLDHTAVDEYLTTHRLKRRVRSVDLVDGDDRTTTIIGYRYDSVDLGRIAAIRFNTRKGG